MENPEGGISVEVCFAKPDRYALEKLIVPPGATLRDAVIQSGIIEQFPEIDLAVCRVGIYGKLKTLDTVLRDRDRVEIYRPLQADPKEARRKRAGKKGGKPPT